jgi:archaellum component FlaF (FlaF/FlaG flagellin family)
MSKINSHNYEAFLIDYLDGNLSEMLVAELKAFVIANPQFEIDLNDMDLPSFAKDEIKVNFKNDLKKATSFIEDEELINYLEHNLSEINKSTFEHKLLKDKLLSNKLEAYKKTVLLPESSLVFSGKSALCKTEDDLILANSPLLFFEKQMSLSEKLNFESELKTNFVFKKELIAFQKTKLEADKAVVFPNKAELKKEAKIIALFSFRTVVSVAAAILLIIGFAFVFNYYNSKPEINQELAKTNFNEKLKNDENHPVKLVASINYSNSTVSKSEVLIAKNTTKISKNNFLKKDSVIKLQKPETNSFANKESPTADDKKELSNEPKLVISNNKSLLDTNSAVANANVNIPKYSKQNYLIAEEIEVEEFIAAAPEKKGFWQRAVSLAKKANKLGVKSLDGSETSNQNYSLSFNSFSIEKR